MKRLQRKGYYDPIPKGAKLVARPTRYGNPYFLTDYSLSRSLVLYDMWLTDKLMNNRNFLNPLFDAEALVCYCSLDDDCHAEILIERIKKLKKNV